MNVYAYLIHFRDNVKKYPLTIEKGELVIHGAPGRWDFDYVLEHCEDFGMQLEPQPDAQWFRPYFTELMSWKLSQTQNGVGIKRKYSRIWG